MCDVCNDSGTIALQISDLTRGERQNNQAKEEN